MAAGALAPASSLRFPQRTIASSNEGWRIAEGTGMERRAPQGDVWRRPVAAQAAYPSAAMPSFQWHATPSTLPSRNAVSSSTSHRVTAGMSNGFADDVSARLHRLLFTDAKALRVHVGDCFDQATMGDKHLDLAGLVLFISYLSRRLGVPPDAFGDVHDQFLRFDFDGNGSLEPHETYKLVKAQLVNYWRRTLGHRVDVPIPTKTLEEAGYVPVKQLGMGSQGTVMLVKDKMNDDYCIKSVSKNSQNSDVLSDIQEEFMKMKYLQNANIASTHEIFQDASFYYVVNDPYFGGDLTQLKSRARQAGVSMTKDAPQLTSHQNVEVATRPFLLVC